MWQKAAAKGSKKSKKLRLIKGSSKHDWGGRSKLFHRKVGRSGRRGRNLIPRICGKFFCCKLSCGEMILVDGKLGRGMVIIVGSRVRIRKGLISVIIAIRIKLSMQRDL